MLCRGGRALTNDAVFPRTRLGRGLGSLLPQMVGVDEVDIDLIVPNPRQPRTAIDPEALAELAESVRAHGILQPLLVSRRVSEGGVVTYQLIAGERRLDAARAAARPAAAGRRGGATAAGMPEQAACAQG